MPPSTFTTPLIGTVSDTHTAVSVGVADGVVLAANPAAKYRMFQNDSTSATIYLFCNGTAALSTGIKLLPGDSYEMSLAVGNMDNRAIHGIASAATTNLLVTEGV
jgi:hypothetical protein